MEELARFQKALIRLDHASAFDALQLAREIAVVSYQAIERLALRVSVLEQRVAGLMHQDAPL